MSHPCFKKGTKPRPIHSAGSAALGSTSLGAEATVLAGDPFGPAIGEITGWASLFVGAGVGAIDCFALRDSTACGLDAIGFGVGAAGALAGFQVLTLCRRAWRRDSEASASFSVA